MKKNLLLLTFLLSIPFLLQAQVGIGTENPHKSAALEIESNEKGLLIPRVTIDQRNAIQNPATALLIFQIDGISGFYYWNGNSWALLKNLAQINADWESTSGESQILNKPKIAEVGISGDFNDLNNIPNIVYASDTAKMLLPYLTLSKIQPFLDSKVDLSAFETEIARAKAAESTNAVNIAQNTASINILDTKVAANTSDIQTNASAISANEGDITTLNATVSQNSTDIQANASNISTNTTGINSLNNSVSQNTVSINTLDTNVAANTSDIQMNATNISTNTTGINSLNTVVSQNTVSINTLDTKVSANTLDIQSNATAISANEGDITTLNATVSQNSADIQTNATNIALKENSANKSTDATLADETDTKFPTEKAVKTYVDGKVIDLSSDVSAILPISNGGTGSSTKDFVDLTTDQNINGVKIFTNDLKISGITVGVGGGAPESAAYNTAFGLDALVNNTGWGNTAMGRETLTENANSNNTAVGYRALRFSVNGNNNVALGSSSLTKNTDGNVNNAIGANALGNNISGSENTAVGRSALITNTTGGRNTALGNLADVSINSLTNATAIGYNAKVAISNTIQLGNIEVTDVITTGKLTTGEITLPNTDGSAGQVLSTNGSGEVTWITTSTPLAVREVADEFTATPSQTSFTLTQTPSVNSKVKMYINGIRISNAAYSVSGNTLTYDPAFNGAYALEAGDRIQMDFYY